MLRYYHDHLRPPHNVENAFSGRAATLPFYFHSAGSWLVGPEYYVRRDQRYDYYLLYTVSGTGFMNYMDERYSLTKGTVMFIDCMKYHYYGASENWEHVWFHINGSGVKDFYQNINSPKAAPVLLDDDARIMALFRTLEKHKDKQALKSEMKVAHAIMELLGVILEKKLLSEGASSMDVPDWYHDLNEYVYQSGHGTITVFDLAKRYDVSVDELERLYKLFSGIELVETLRANRENFTKTKKTVCDNPAWLLETVAYLKNNFTSRISLDELIEKSHVSRSTFMSKFKQYAAMSPMQYTIKLRIDRAKALLEKTNNTTSSIAYECGFASASDFSKKFKEFTGITPNEYRRRR